jgi:LysR family glycine cleavage system transcriptional activator
MTRPLPPLATLRAFVAIAEHGRFNRAADALGLTETAVSHQLRKLEDRLGITLIERRREGAVLTDAGRRFHRPIAEAVRLIAEAVDDLSGGDPGKVTMTLPHALATHWLVPLYGELHRAHPDIELQVLPTSRLCDLRRERIDFAIRYGNGEWPGLEAVHLMEEACFPVAAPDHARLWQDGGWTGAAPEGRIIVNGLHPDEWRLWCAYRGLPEAIGRRTTELASFDLVLQAGLAGAGLIMGRRPMIDEFLRRGELIAPFGTDAPPGASYYLVWPKDRPPAAKARAVMGWLKSRAAKRPSL